MREARQRLAQRDAERRQELAVLVENVYRTGAFPTRDLFVVAVYGECGGGDLLRPSRAGERATIHQLIDEVWAARTASGTAAA